MPQLILDGVALIAAPPPEPPKPEVVPDAPLDLWADTAWTLAMLDAWDAYDRAQRAIGILARVTAGDEWFRTHGEDHPKYERSRVLLLNLRDQLAQEWVAFRCYERQAWFRCVEAHGFWTNAEVATVSPQELWSQLFGNRPPPSLDMVNGCLVTRSLRSSAAPWQLEDLRTLLATKAGAS